MTVLYGRFVASGGAITKAHGFVPASPGLTEMPYGITSVLQTRMLIAIFLILLTGALSRGASAIWRRDLRWILMAYCGGFLVTLVTRLFDLPEMTGLSYPVFGGMVYLGIQKGYLLVLSPGNYARQILGSMSEILFITDPSYVIMALNQEALSFFGRTEVDCVGHPLTEIAGVGEISPGSELRSPDEQRWLRIAETPVLSRTGISLGKILLGKDTTDEKRHAALLYRSLAEKRACCRKFTTGSTIPCRSSPAS